LKNTFKMQKIGWNFKYSPFCLHLSMIVYNWNWRSLVDNNLKFIHFKVFCVTKARWAESSATIYTVEAIFVSWYNSRTSLTLLCLIACIRCNHALARLFLLAWFKSLNTFFSHAETKAFFGSSKHHQMFCKILKHFELILLKLLSKQIF